MIQYIKRNLEALIIIVLILGSVVTYKLCKTAKPTIDQTETLTLKDKLTKVEDALATSDSIKLDLQGRLDSYTVIIKDLELNPKVVTKFIYKDTGSTKFIIKNTDPLVIYTDTATGPRITLPFSYPLHNSVFFGSIEGKEDSTMEVKIDSFPNKIEVTKTEQRDPKNKFMTNTLVTIKNTNPILSNNNSRVDSINFSKLNDDGLKMIEDAGREAGKKEGKKKGFWNGIKVASGIIVTAMLILLVK